MKNVDNSSQSKPVMLSSKRAIEKPDLSKYKYNVTIYYIASKF